MNPETEKIDGYKILLTGGNGFLGRAIVKELLKEDSQIKVNELRILDVAGNGQKDPRITFLQGDVRDQSTCNTACEGIDLVIHSAAIVDWGTKSTEEVMAVNYGGTDAVINSCRLNRVKALLFTSSLDVLFDGNPLVDVDESHPYPETHSNSYCRSKFLAEKLVLDNNDDELQTVVLRPSDIYGEADPYHIGSLVNMAKGGFYVRLGNGQTRSQHVYVGNIAHAHVLAAKAMLKSNRDITGNAYFITDGPGSNFFHFFDSIVEAAGYRIWPKKFWIPYRLAYTLGSISEFIAVLLRPIKYYNPKMSRFAVKYTCTDYTFNSEKARKEFGFEPIYSEEEALKRSAAYFSKLPST